MGTSEAAQHTELTMPPGLGEALDRVCGLIGVDRHAVLHGTAQTNAGRIARRLVVAVAHEEFGLSHARVSSLLGCKTRGSSWGIYNDYRRLRDDGTDIAYATGLEGGDRWLDMHGLRELIRSGETPRSLKLREVA